MTIKHLLGSVTIALALGACGKGGGGGAVFDEFMKLESDKAVAFAVGGEDCEAKAKSVGDWRKKHTARYNELRKKLNDQWPKGPPKDIEEKHGEKMKANKKAVMDAMFACANNEAFGRMMDETKTE